MMCHASQSEWTDFISTSVTQFYTVSILSCQNFSGPVGGSGNLDLCVTSLSCHVLCLLPLHLHISLYLCRALYQRGRTSF